MQSNHDKSAANNKIKGRFRKVKKNAKKNRQITVSHLELELDLETPNSILVHTDLKLLFSQQTFATLSERQQMQLLKLLPGCDQDMGPSSNVRLAAEALNNEFFAKACTDWKRKLAEGKFTQESQVLANMEHEKEQARMDPWKRKHYESFWGEKQTVCSSAETDHRSSHPIRDRGQPEARNAKIIDLPTTVSPQDRLHDLPVILLNKEVETSRILTAPRPLNIASRSSQCTTPASSSCQSSQAGGGATGTLSGVWSRPLSACKMDSLIFSTLSLSASPVTSSVCSSGTSHCHTLASLNAAPQSSLPHVAPSVVLLTVPFLNSGTGSVVPNFQTVVSSSSMLAAASSAGVSKVSVNRRDDSSLLLSSTVLPLRFPAPATHSSCNVPASDSSRKRLLDGLAESCFHPPDAKRMLLSAHNTSSSDTENARSVAGGSVGTLSTRLIPISNGSLTSVINGHQTACQPLPRLAAEPIQTVAPAPTTLFSIPVQGLSGRGACPLVFMLPQAVPRTDINLSQPRTTSNFICLVNPPRPSISFVPSSVPISTVDKCAAKSDLFLPASVVSPYANGTRLSSFVPATSVATSNNVHVVRPASSFLPLSKRQEPLYVVSLPSAAPVVRQLLEKSNAVSSPAWAVRLPSVGDVKTESPMTASAPPFSIFRFTPKPNGLVSSLAGIRLISSIPASSCQVPALVERRFMSSSSSSTAAASSVQPSSILSFIQNSAAVSSSSFQCSTCATVSSIQSTALKSIAALPSFPSQMTAVLPKPLPGCAASHGILRTLLSRNTMPLSSLISSPAESISRSLSHLYTLNACKNSSSSVRLLSSPGVVCRTPGNSTVSEGSENKCGKCGAPCLLTDSAGQLKLCITCLIMA